MKRHLWGADAEAGRAPSMPAMAFAIIGLMVALGTYNLYEPAYAAVVLQLGHLL